MAFEKALSALASVMRGAIKLEDKDLVVPEDQKVNSRARHDDDVTGGDIANLVTKLSDDVGFRRYRQQQAKVSNARDLWELRGKELKLLFSKQVAETRINSFWKNEYASNVVRNSDFQKQLSEEGTLSSEDLVSRQRTGNNTFGDFVPDEDRGKVSDHRRNKLIEDRKGGPSNKSQDTSYRFTTASTGASGPLIKLHISDDDPSRQHSTDNLMQRTVASLEGDSRTMKVFVALLLRWKIELPTFLKSGKVPAEWKQLQAIYEKDEEGYSKNLRKLLEEVGVKDFRMDSGPVKKLQETLLSLTGSKDERELRNLLVEAVKNTGQGGGGFSSGNKNSDDSFSDSEQLGTTKSTLGKGWVNESALGSIMERLDDISERAPSAREMKAFELLDAGIQSGDIALKMHDWQFVIPTLVWVNRRRKTPAWRRAMVLTGESKSAMVSKTLRKMFAESPKNAKILDVLGQLITAPINESLAVAEMLTTISESFREEDWI